MVTKAELVAKWVEKLRYPYASQTRTFLRRDDGSRCALGFLCDAAEDLGLGEWIKGEYGWKFVDNNGDGGQLNFPPRLVTDCIDPAGKQDIVVAYGSRHAHVFFLNDSVKLSLAEISDLVEAEYL